MNVFVLSVSNESETKSSNANSKWILRNLFVQRSNPTPGLKTDVDFRG